MGADNHHRQFVDVKNDLITLPNKLLKIKRGKIKLRDMHDMVVLDTRKCWHLVIVSICTYAYKSHIASQSSWLHLQSSKGLIHHREIYDLIYEEQNGNA